MPKKLFVLLAVVFLFLMADVGLADYSAHVRVVQLSPNAEGVRVELQSVVEEDEAPVRANDWVSMDYLDSSAFVAVVPGDFHCVVEVDGITLTKRITLEPDEHYTVDLAGLVVPEELEKLAAEGLDTDVWHWLKGLFLGEEPTEHYLFQPRIFSDDLSPVPEDYARVRLVHAAPGLGDMDLAFRGQHEPLIEGLSFGGTSSYIETMVEEYLEIRLHGTQIAVQHSLPDVQMETGNVYTVFLVGTPVDINAPHADMLVLADDALPREE